MTNQTEIIKFNINEDYCVEIKRCQGSYGEYYCVNGTNYDIHFPIEWVFQTPLNETEMDIPCFGPEECNLCAEHGYYGGVFIGYCLHCAKHSDFKRGNGMLSAGVEIDQTTADNLGIPIEYKEENSMWNVYMQTAELSQIGDEELLNKHISFFHHRKKMNTNEMERVFDFYGWLNASLDVGFYVSAEEDASIESDDPEWKSLQLVLPENCMEE
jgi:hypothetical protein